MVTNIQRAFCVVLSLIFLGVVAVLPGDFFRHGEIYRQLPLYCFLEKKALQKENGRDRETEMLLQKKNAEHLGEEVEAENRKEQETLLKLYLERKPFRSPEHERYWVVRVAVNESKKLLRSPWRRRTGPLEEAGEPVFDTPQQSELYQHVMGLPPKYRAAVYLYYYEDCSVQEIAAAMGANPSTVQTWLMRARGKLKLILQEAES